LTPPHVPASIFLQWQYSLRSNLLLTVVILSSYLLWLGQQLPFLFAAYSFVSLINVLTDFFFPYNLRLWYIAQRGHMIAGALVTLAAAVYLAAPEIV